MLVELQISVYLQISLLFNEFVEEKEILIAGCYIQCEFWILFLFNLLFLFYVYNIRHSKVALLTNPICFQLDLLLLQSLHTAALENPRRAFAHLDYVTRIYVILVLDWCGWLRDIWSPFLLNTCTNYRWWYCPWYIYGMIHRIWQLAWKLLQISCRLECLLGYLLQVTQRPLVLLSYLTYLAQGSKAILINGHLFALSSISGARSTSNLWLWAWLRFLLLRLT